MEVGLPFGNLQAPCGNNCVISNIFMEERTELLGASAKQKKKRVVIVSIVMSGMHVISAMSVISVMHR